MAQRKGGYQGTFNRCERPGCGCIAAKWSVYSDRMLCNSCLSFERAAALVQQADRDAIAANVAQAAQEIAKMNAQQAEYQRIDIANAANLRSLAAESRDPANVEYFGQQAKFYEDRAAQRAGAGQ